jgi:hypothetical protein
MYSWNDPDDRVAIVQMNADLRHAQLDLLSAQCATDRLRLRFSVEDLARYGEKDVLRKTIGTAVALNDYYLSIQNEMPADSASLPESQVLQAVRRVADYHWNQREIYRRSGSPLSGRQKEILEPFFSSSFSTGFEWSNSMVGAFPLPRFIWKLAPWASAICPS